MYSGYQDESPEFIKIGDSISRFYLIKLDICNIVKAVTAAQDDSFRDFRQIISRLDQLIKSGQSSIAKTELVNLLESKVKIPRQDAANIANLARRLSLPMLALKIMRPYIHPRTPIHPEVSDFECAVYAGVLAKVGASSEALNRLDKVDPGEVPEAYFHKSSVYFQRWDYAKSIPLLKKYIQHEKITGYERLIGKVNLAAAYVVERKVQEASGLLKELLQTTQKENLRLLQGNVLELSAQLEIFAKNYSQAEVYLQAARECLDLTSNLSEFFIRKWISILELKKMQPPTQDAISRLNEIRQEALRLKHWETVRECDFYLSVALKNKNLFFQVYFGTPFPKYRRRMKAEAPSPLSLPTKYIWNVSSEAIPKGIRIFDLASARELNREIFLPKGGVLHRALIILGQDFYRPVSEGSFFSQLFPDEYFNPESSPQRVAQVAHRLRLWFRENEIPLEIEVHHSAYRLSATKSYGLQIVLSHKKADPRYARLDILKAKWPYQSFSSSQAAAELKCSASVVVRLFSWARTKKLIFTSGHGRSTLYRFAK